MIECMCLVCHGPLPQRSKHGSPNRLLCSVNCRSIQRYMAQGRPLPWRYQDLRMAHAYRRELAMAAAWIAERSPLAAVLLEVS